MIQHHLVIDQPTLLALGSGNRNASALIHRAYRDPSTKLWVPVLCVLEADRERHGVAAHVGALEVLNAVDLTFSDILAVSQLCASPGLTPGIAHAVQVAAPSFEHPEGAIVATLAPDAYQGTGTRVMDLNK
ncbi:hypothetical protein E1265_01410 [Streptomyces sp. 8K308]|uniref:hypothetical protein n=1 Tax=Streptomyces sp. 8K308 TaxID=2530388 RepID=UPI00104A06EA|nr:hypothetical protein [Streptomyces sp. 8K308]TDC27577.1 hypothetical protein E1265_01410 [Streptomyces sp. 8K308]